MHYPSKIGLSIFSLLLLSSCFKKVTCPAFQSQYLVDKEAFKKEFSLFESDSVPKENIGEVKKNKFGIIVEKPYHRKINEMKTIDMVTIYPERQDSVLMVNSIPDSLASDSAAATRPSPYLTSFNYDQLVYNTLFGNAIEQQKRNAENARNVERQDEKAGQEGEKEKRSFFDFLKRKKKENGDDAPDGETDEVQPPPDQSAPDQTQPPEDQPPPDNQPAPANQDDGF